MVVDGDLIEKPSDWPCNNREATLDMIYNAMQKFIANPDYKNREALFTILNPTDINEIDERGLIAFREYEVALINELYTIAVVTNCQSLKVYLYGHIARFTRLFKFISQQGILNGCTSTFIKEFEFLLPPLQMFYLAYRNFNLLKDRSFADSIIDVVKVNYQFQDEQHKKDICIDFNTLLFDLSYANSNNNFPYLCFDRKELKKLFQLSAELNNDCKNKINERPLLGVMKMTIRQWILKSRNEYKNNNIYKSISIKNALSSHSNHQVWMSKITKLNDKREQKAIKTIFANKKWINYNWAKKVTIGELTDSFVCSFSNERPTDKMAKKYGGVVLGYKTDRIADILSPVYLENGCPRFEQVFWFDILYDEKEAKDEINYLCDIIALFDLTDGEKSSFLNDILEYWYLSVKDKKWNYEKERRYQTFVFDYKTYHELVIEDDYLKIKSSLYLCPDFILNSKSILKLKFYKLRKYKTNAIMTQDYYFCEECLQANRALYGQEKEYCCPVCGSKNIHFYAGNT